MLGYAVMSGMAFVCAKYISTNWSGALKLTFGHFFAFMLSWLLGGIVALLITSLFSEITKNAVPVFFARGFWWALIGMFFGMYKAKKDKTKIVAK